MNGAGAFAIEIDGLVKTYGSHRAVDGLSLQVKTGEIFGLLGPNGAGKTTTVETLEGYRVPDAGTVRVLGLDPRTQAGELLGRIGVMLQDGGLYPGLKPLEALSLFASYYPNPDDPERLLNLVGLSDVRNIVVRRLSGGQAQRLSLATALIGRPELVFLDEPTAGMDPHARATTWELVRTLRGNGVTVLLTTHAMDEAEQLCDRVAIIDHGRLVACDTPSALTRSGDTNEVRFTTEAGLDTTALASVLALDGARIAEHRPGEYHIACNATPALIADLAAWLRDAHATLLELRTGRGSLEDVFLQLTKDSATNGSTSKDRAGITR